MASGSGTGTGRVSARRRWENVQSANARYEAKLAKQEAKAWDRAKKAGDRARKWAVKTGKGADYFNPFA